MALRAFTLLAFTALTASAISSQNHPPSHSSPCPSPIRNVTIHQPHLPVMPYKHLPEPHAASKADQIVRLFQNLGRSTVWKLVEKVQFEGDMGEPEGIVRIGDDRYVVSAGDWTVPTISFNGSIINGTDRTPGAGYAHMKVFDSKGILIADATVSKPGSDEYHTGGLDFDGKYIYSTIAQYRPNTTAHIIQIDPRTLDYTTLFQVKDHFGGSVHDTKTNLLYTLNWGARNVSTYDLGDKHLQPCDVAKPLRVARNPTYFIDYQDCKFLGRTRAYDNRPVMICSGVATIGKATIGGVAIVDLLTLVPLAEVPMALVSDLGAQINGNPMDVDVVDGKLRFYLMPDQHNSTLYVYEAQPNSPYEY